MYVCVYFFLAMDYSSQVIVIFLLLSLLTLKSIRCDGLRLPDQPSQQQSNLEVNQQQPQQTQAFGEERGRQGKGLLNIFGFGSDGNADPYIAKINGNCLSGDLSECFKSQALTNFDEIFFLNSYQYVFHLKYHFLFLKQLSLNNFVG